MTATSPAPVVSIAVMAALEGMEARLRLGHYSSGDGLTGFVLDRTRSPVKLRIDGRPEIVALTTSTSRASWTRLENALGRTILEVDVTGRVRYFAGGHADGVAMFRDADAAKLGDADVAPLVSPSTVAEANASVRDKCSADVLFDVDFASMGGDEEALRNAQWQMARATEVLTRMCRDAIGKAAVRAKLGSIRLRSVAPSRRRIDHDGRSLVLDQPFATSKGATLREIEEVLTRWL